MKRNIFKTPDEILNSDFWTTLIKAKSKPHNSTRIFKSTRLEDLIYSDLRSSDDSSVVDLEKQGAEKLDTFPSLIRDTFQALYSINPKRNNPDTLAINARIFNAGIMDAVQGCKEYSALKSLCEGRDISAFEALTEFSDQILSKLDELLNAADGGKNLHHALEKLEKHKNKLTEQVERMMDEYNNGNLGGKEESELLKAAGKAMSKQRQIEAVSDMMRQNMRKSKETFQGIVVTAVVAALSKVEQVEAVIGAWGSDGSNPESRTQNKELLDRVRQSNRIFGLVKYLGKYREIMENARKNSFAFGRGAKYDIALGNDFTRAVSSEYAYLAMQETIPLFIRKVQQKRLKQYRKREMISKGYGDVVICLDESGSMEGDPIAWAKAVTLTLMEATVKNGRKCAVVRFGSNGQHEIHEFPKGSYGTDDILSFVESFLDGGTDFEWPLTKATELIVSKGYENADIVFVTDGICAVSDEFADSFKQSGHAHNFTVTGIVMDTDMPGMEFSLAPFCIKVYRLSEMTCNNVAESIIINYS